MRGGWQATGQRLVTTATGNPLKDMARTVRTHAILGLLVGVLILTLAGCGDDDDNFGAGIVVPLTGAEEVPPRTTGGSGTATLVVGIINQTIAYTLEQRGTFTSAIQQAHIHSGARGVNGPIFLFLCSNIGAPPTVPTPPPCPTGAGRVEGTLTAANFIPVPGIASFAAGIDAIFTGNTYVNSHSVTFPGGEIRGQVVP